MSVIMEDPVYTKKTQCLECYDCCEGFEGSYCTTCQACTAFECTGSFISIIPTIDFLGKNEVRMRVVCLRVGVVCVSE